MRTYLFVLLAIIGLLLAACHHKDSTAPINEPYALVVILMDSVAVDSFYVTEDDNGEVLPVYNGEAQIGEIEIGVRWYWSENDLCSHIRFYTIAREEGCYTVYDAASDSGRIQVDYVNDFEAYNPDLNCGVLFATSHYYGSIYGPLSNTELTVLSEGDSVGTINTDDEGRFETSITAGDYTIVPLWYSFELADSLLHLVDGYADYTILGEYIQADKPNIYLYPQAPTTLDVSVVFPHGGMVTSSEPQYPQQWQSIHVQPDGTIDGKYGYLFYECEVPDFAQRSAGWVVARTELEAFFTRNLRETGFIGREIDDFIDWWIPRLTDADWYAVYPQYAAQLDPVMALSFSQQPDNIQRLIYAVQPLESPNLTLAAPQIPAFERTGFVAVEWGVIPLNTGGKAVIVRR